MGYDVTSWFIDQSRARSSSPVRKITIAGSDYSSYVTKWPSFRRVWNDVRPVPLTIKLANEDGAFNFFRENPLTLVSSVLVQFGFTHPTSGDELIELYSGRSQNVSYDNGSISLRIVDKFQQLSERVMGSSDVPVTYTGSNYLPADIAWWAITSYGGYDVTADSSNTDIGYASWKEWSDVFSSDAVYMQAEFDGQKVTEVLRKIARHTRSAIFNSDGKIQFQRFSIIDPHVTSYGPSELVNLSVELDDTDTVNKQYVFADYSTTSDYWQITAYDEAAASVNSYGLREDTEKDKNLWYVNSSSAINLAQRIINTKSEPYEQVSIDGTLVGLPLFVGETFYAEDALLGISESYRIMEQSINMDNGIVKLKGDRSQLFGGFILDTSTLNGPEILS